jgi:hypothetical protein
VVDSLAVEALRPDLEVSRLNIGPKVNVDPHVIPTFYTIHAPHVPTPHANNMDHEARAVYVRKHSDDEDL